AITMILQGCSAAGINSSAQSIGTLNRLVIVADNDVWEGPIGDTIRYYLGAAYPVLPQPEPTFDLQHYTAEEMDEDAVRKRFRSILVLGDTKNQMSFTTQFIKKEIGEENIIALQNTDEKSAVKVSKNRWVGNQKVMFLYADGEEALVDAIKDRCSSIAGVVEKSDSNMLNSRVYLRGKNQGLARKIKEDFGANIPIPGEYIEAFYDADKKFAWIRKDKKVAIMNLMIHKRAYKDTSQLSIQGVKSLRDSLGAKYITSVQEGSYMRVNDWDLKLYHEFHPIAGKFGVELRGIWEMKNDAMGGPFMSYMIHDAEAGEVLFVDAFVFAPNKKKRDLMQELNVVMDGITFD
ncbi:MAG: DUF4837 family protein, partial [Saprospiraceae bacterium]